MGSTQSGGFSIGALWRGELGLAKTYWIYNPVSAFASVLLAVGLSLLWQGSDAVGALILIAHWFFISVAIWRSANKYHGPSIWPVLAKGVLLLPFFGIIIAIAITTWGAVDNASKYTPEISQTGLPRTSQSANQPTESIDWEKGVITPPQASPAQSATSDPATDAHYKAIYQAHPDADDVANSAQFQHWLTMYPAYRTVMDNGTTQQIIEMFTAFKMQRHRVFDPATARPATQ